MNEYVRHLKQQAKVIASRLGQLDLELTERCNNDCIHCCINRPAGDTETEAREMTTGQVKDILQQAADLGCLQVRFTGGEPLLRPDFEELYTFARRSGLRVLVFTNARLVTPRLADLFARIPPRVEVEVTAYGMRQDSYEAVTRAAGSFEQFWRGLNLLWDRNVPFVVKSALLPPNKPEMDEFEAWAKRIPWMARGPSYAMFFDLRSRRDSAGKNRLIESLRLSPREGVAVLARDEPGYSKEMVKFASKFMGRPGRQLFCCGAGRDICVDAYGCAHPCLGLRAPELMCAVAGTNGTGLSGALAHFTALGEVQATNPEYLRRCALCFLKGLCDQCPAKSWSEHGTLDRPVEYLCQVAHAQARHLGWLGKDEHGWEVRDWQRRIEMAAQ